jgi:hypothetical protein
MHYYAISTSVTSERELSGLLAIWNQASFVWRGLAQDDIYLSYVAVLNGARLPEK